MSVATGGGGASSRTILGPQERFERAGSASLRDIRPVATRLREALRGPASGLVLLLAAGGAVAAPASVHLTVPLGLLYAAWVLRAPVRLPFRLPVSARRPDPGYPDPATRRPRPAAGTWHLGRDAEGRELWATAADVRQHIAIPGTTGAGKTTAILSLLANPLAQGSGFVLVNGKGDRDIFGEVLALARRLGRDDDVRVLNFMVASGGRDSHTFNPFASGNADAVREMLVSLLGEQGPNDGNGVFRDRAVALVGTVAPVLVWLRDHRGVPLNIDTIRVALELRWIWRMAMERRAGVRDAATGATREVACPDMPDEIVWPLRAYLGELPGYDPNLPLHMQKGEEPSKQHGYAQMYFTQVFQQLGVSLGHIFRCEGADIDMRDVVLNRRILVVNIPALENSEATNAALGRLVVASLRGMMAQLLGVSLEGEYGGGRKEGMGEAPFAVVLDELAAYASGDLTPMLAQGRSLNVCFLLGFQEVPGIWARLGERTATLLGNANITIAMRQAEAGRTREWIEKTAGQTNVTQATAWHGTSDGAYREARSAEVRTVSRVDWNDLTSLLEGEAVVLAGGRRIYASVLHATVSDPGPKRIGRTVALAPLDAEALRAEEDRLDALAAAIGLEGRAANDGPGPPSPALDAVVGAFARAAAAGAAARACADAALLATLGLDEAALPPRPAAPAGGPPATPVTRMLAEAARRPVPGGGEAVAGPAGAASDAAGRAGLDVLAEACRLAGAGGDAGRTAALALLAERDRALAAVGSAEPLAVAPAEMAVRLDRAIAGLRRVVAGGPSSSGGPPRPIGPSTGEVAP